MHVLGGATDCLDGGTIRTSKEMTDIVPQRLLSDNGSDINLLANINSACRASSSMYKSYEKINLMRKKIKFNCVCFLIFFYDFCCSYC